jgi:2-C-methyl-D-erythritol 4-phosphate cytidylyltransferase
VTTAVLVPAAGRGERLGRPQPKALVPVGGQVLLVHAVRAACQAPSVSLVVVAVPADRVSEATGLLAAAVPQASVRVVAGGATRRESVQAGLAALPAEVDVVLVHDAARAFAPPELFEQVAAAVRAGAEAVVPAVELADTVRWVGTDRGATTAVDREALLAVQTPQGFARQVLDRAHAVAGAGDGARATDDATLVERAGGKVLVVAGCEEAFKVTGPLDLLLAEALVARRAGMA